MALFGRETEADRQRIDRRIAWLHQQNRKGLASLGFGFVAVVDSLTLVVGIIAAVVGLIFGFMSLREIKSQIQGNANCETNSDFNIQSKGWSYAGITLSVLGLLFSMVMWLVIIPKYIANH